MAKKKMTEAEINSNLGIIFQGDVIEALMDVFEDPCALHSPGAVIRTSAALREVVERFEDSAKEIIAMQIEGASGARASFEDRGVVFTSVEGSTVNTLDRAAVARKIGLKELSYSTAPELYKQTKRRGYIKTELN